MLCPADVAGRLVTGVSRPPQSNGAPSCPRSRGGGAGNRIVGGETQRGPTDANGGIRDHLKAPIGPVGARSIPLADDSDVAAPQLRRSRTRRRLRTDVARSVRGTITGRSA